MGNFFKYDLFEYALESDEVEDIESAYWETAESARALRKAAVAKLRAFPNVQRLVRQKQVKFRWVRDLRSKRDNSRLRGQYDGYDNVVSLDKSLKGRREALGVMLHEMIHAVGGSELDAEYYENSCCTRAEGAVPPCQNDWQSEDFENEISSFGITLQNLRDVLN